MGTRGTLKVFVNDELKIRQYNQWDSYPTGQFQEICAFFRDGNNVANLTQTLVNTKLATAEMTKKWRDRAFTKEESYIDAYLTVLTDRDIGAGILHILAGVPNACEYLPDWLHIHEDGTDDLPPEEGNYVIHIDVELKDMPPYSSRKYIKPETIRFRLEGEYHGIEKNFQIDYVPTDDECDEWECEEKREG